MPLTEEEKKERKRVYRKNNKAKIAIYNAKYRAEHNDEIKAKDKEYREANRDARLGYTRAWRDRNKDAVKAKNKAYRESNRDACRARVRNHYKRNKLKCRDNAKRYTQELTDGYIKARLKQKSILTSEKIPQSLIEAKRLELKMKRFIKEQKNGS